MTQAQLAAHILGRLRREKQPPLMLYAMILTLVARPRQTVPQLAAALDDDANTIRAALNRGIRRGDITRDSNGLFLATPEGEDAISHLFPNRP